MRSVLLTLGLTPFVVRMGVSQRASKVTTTEVVSMRFAAAERVSGELIAKRVVELGSEVAGRVASTSFEEGASLAEGHALLVLDTKLLALRAAGARARVAAAEQQLLEFRAGARTEEIGDAEAEVARCRALSVDAERNLERERAKRKQDIGSDKALTDARALAATRKAELESAEQKLALIKAGPRDERIARAEQDLALRKSELDEILVSIEKATIRAPFDAVVTRKRVGTGSFVRVGDPVASLVQIDPIRVRLSVPARSIGFAKRGAKLRFEIDALPGETFEGTTTAIIPDADRMSRAFPVHLELANPKARLLPGMFVRAQLRGVERDALALPRDAIVSSPRGSVVYVVRDGKAQLVPVRIGEAEKGMVEIRGDIEVGTAVIVRGNDGLRPGSDVIVVGREARDGRSEKR